MVSSLDENVGVMTEQEHSSAIQHLEKITKKTTILMRNWNAEGKTAKSKEEKREIDIYYRRYLDHYVARQRALERLITVYDEHYRESPMQETIPTPRSAIPVTTVPQSPVSHIPTEAEIMATHEALLESLTLSSNSSDGSLTYKKENIPTSQISKTIPSTTEETRGTYPLSTQNVPGLEGRSTTTSVRITQSRELKHMTLTTTTVSTILSATHPTQTSEMSMISGRTTTVPTTATRIIPITREESRHNALEAVRRLVGPNSAAAFPSVTEPMQDEVRIMSPPPVPQLTGAISPEVGTAVPISHDLIWPGHPKIRGTTLFPQEDDPMTRAAGGLNPDKRWRVFHPYNIPGVRRPTMTTPENIRRMAESEALIESIQTMEYLNEFPSMGERRDFRRFPPRYGDPHYHPNRLGRRSMESNQERLDNQTDNTRSIIRQDQRGSERRSAYGRGFMSPMRRVAEAAQHVPEAVYSDSETQNISSPIVPIIPEEQQRDQSSILPQGEFQDMERGDSLQQQPNIVSPTNILDDWEAVEPVIIPVSKPVLNGGPPIHNGTPTPIHTETPTREREEEISPSPQRENSLHPEDQRIEAIQNSREVISVLPSEDPHIPCSVCEVIDCMIHNPVIGIV